MWSSRLVLLLAVLASSATVHVGASCIDCARSGQTWCKASTYSTSPLDGTCSDPWCPSLRKVSSYSDCPGAQQGTYQNCLQCAAAGLYWCPFSSTSTSNTYGTCVSQSNYCPWATISSRNSCPDSFYLSKTNCIDCAGHTLGLWCKDKSTADDYAGTCVHSSSDCPSSLQVVLSSSCPSKDAATENALKILGMSILVFIIVCVVLPVIAVIACIWLCVRMSRSKTVIVTHTPPAPVERPIWPANQGYQPPGPAPYAAQGPFSPPMAPAYPQHAPPQPPPAAMNYGYPPPPNNPEYHAL